MELNFWHGVLLTGAAGGLTLWAYPPYKEKTSDGKLKRTLLQTKEKYWHFYVNKNQAMTWSMAK